MTEGGGTLTVETMSVVVMALTAVVLLGAVGVLFALARSRPESVKIPSGPSLPAPRGRGGEPRAPKPSPAAVRAAREVLFRSGVPTPGVKHPYVWDTDLGSWGAEDEALLDAALRAAYSEDTRRG